ncbi:hypothetical protein DAPPUDRAFT_105110 [Daphnia pulex]|uniref:Uncharacterized protein n=1 Tax=Daphnia pulex TaxID=6669 RepID=E9GPI1_DAPPU|nr:hypothetical protein DAPPUDRAFT_105110 [Daphnia pulex]|eukprot:EFX78671.1 hypothetical protein DAPPUDRAFT_105110 [Daphnia pulex]
MSRALPGARSRSCHYHSGNAIYQYAARIGLTAAYRENKAERIGPDRFCVYKDANRTNNLLEAQHRLFNAIVGLAHSAPWLFLEKLQEFGMLAVYDYLAVSAGRPVRATMRRQLVIRNRIEDYYLPMEEARAAFEVLLFVGVLPGEHDDRGENDDGLEPPENDPAVNLVDAAAGENPVDAAAGENPVDAAAGENPVDAAAAENPVDAAAAENPVDATAAENPLDADAAVNKPAAATVRGHGQRAGRGGIGSGRVGVGAGRGDEEPDQEEDLPPVRGRGQRAWRGQRAGLGGIGADRGGVGAVRGDEEPGRGEICLLFVANQQAVATKNQAVEKICLLPIT